jgi:hypothetical protein
MPLDVLGRTRVTLTGPASSSLSLVSASHQLALITSLPFVHTARRYYRLNGSVRLSDWPGMGGDPRPGPESYPNSVI